MFPTSLRRFILLFVVIGAFTIFSLNLSPVSGSVGSVVNEPSANLRGDSAALLTAKKTELEVIPGSDAYYAHEKVRDSLKANIKAAADAVNSAVTLISNTTPAYVTRGIIAYLPPAIPHFVNELKWLMLSMGYMRVSQPANFKTDLIIFTAPTEVDKVADMFKCSKVVRSSFEDKEGCVVLPHVKLMDRPVPKGSVPPPLAEYAAYVDSMLVLAEFAHASKYTYLLRSDLDTFLTPGFSDWTLPSGVVLAVGRGGYGHNNANKHLSWIMTQQLGLTDHGLLSLGSTWMGYGEVMKAVARLTLASMDWLHTQEFSDYEKTASGVDGWPYWHWPVILLYGGHIAINQIPKNKLILSPSEIGLDEMTTNTISLDKMIKHLHVFHGDNMFSKFRAHAGQYKDEDITEYLAMDTPQRYATVIGISSLRLSVEEVVKYSTDSEAMRSKAWVRATP